MSKEEPLVVSDEQLIRLLKDANKKLGDHARLLTEQLSTSQKQLADQREAFAVIAETPVSGEQDDITMEAKDRIAKAIREWEPK